MKKGRTQQTECNICYVAISSSLWGSKGQKISKPNDSKKPNEKIPNFALKFEIGSNMLNSP